MLISTLKINIYFLIISVLIIAKCSAECGSHSEIERWCDTLEDIKEGGIKSNWTRLSIRYQDEKVYPIEENEFLNILNLEKLSLFGYFDVKQNSFKDLSKLDNLRVALKVVKKNTFGNLKIKTLHITDVEKLEPGCIDKLSNLKRMMLSESSITNIPAGIFNNTNIELFFIHESKIRTIEEGAFYGMDNLKVFGINGNFITAFDSNIYFGNSKSNLGVLYLTRNNLTQITKNTLKSFPNLRVLIANENNIESVEDGSFNGLNHLTYIDLSNNKLNNLSPTIFPSSGLQNIDLLFLHNNRIKYLSSEIISRLPRLSKISIGLNPWQCPCLEEFEDQLQKKNVTSFCAIKDDKIECEPPKNEDNKCDNNDDGEQYSKLSDNKKQPPWCRLHCDSDYPTCYTDSSSDFLEYAEDLKYLFI